MYTKELNSLPSNVRAFYERSIPADARIPSRTLESYIKDGYQRLFVTYDSNERPVAATFMAIGMLDAIPVLFQSYFVVDSEITSVELETYHVQHVQETLKSSYPNARILFEMPPASESGIAEDERKFRTEYADFVKGLGGSVLWSCYQVPALDGSAPQRYELWQYPQRQEAQVNNETIALYVYVLLRFAYELDATAARAMLTSDDLPTSNQSQFEAAARRVA
ncbi:MAG TPA: hypothetical protein V6C81_18305 [Planktothrix sp.]|jgi:hypothetical protein